MTIQDKQEEIIGSFSFLENWDDKYQYIIDLGKSLPLIDEKHKTTENLIKGCQSQVWVKAELNNDKIIFTADSDAIITKGIIALLLQVFSGHSPEEIMDSQVYFIDKIGLKEHLSPTRSNGLVAMLKQIKMYAIAFQSKK